MEDNTKQSLTADASLYNGQPTDTGSSCPSARLTSCTPSILKNKGWVSVKMLCRFIFTTFHNMSILKHKDLPKWLDKIIYNDFKAIFEPHPQDVVYNPDQPYEFVKIYLGTYFPRSYAESFCIVNNLFENSNYLSSIYTLEEVNILDFCCGTGGEIIGLIDILQSELPNLKRINIDAFDANPDAIRFLYHLMESVVTSGNIVVDINLNPQGVFVSSEQELSDLVNLTNVQYHFIVSFKALNEFIQHGTFKNKNTYSLISSYFLPLLSDVGVFILSDVATKLNNSERYYPQILNDGINSIINSGKNEFKTLYPYSCYFNEMTCNGCYMQDVFTVSHSKKMNDVSKVAYRIICRKRFADAIVASDFNQSCRKNNPLADKNLPYNY